MATDEQERELSESSVSSVSTLTSSNTTSVEGDVNGSASRGVSSRKKTALEQLLADSDWYQTSYNRESRGPRASSLKRDQTMKRAEDERTETLNRLRAEGKLVEPPKRKQAKRDPEAIKRAKELAMEQKKQKQLEYLKRKEELIKQNKWVVKPRHDPLSRLLVEKDYYMRFSSTFNKDVPTEGTYTRGQGLVKKPVLYINEEVDYRSKTSTYTRKKKVSVPSILGKSKTKGKKQSPRPKGKPGPKPKQKSMLYRKTSKKEIEQILKEEDLSDVDMDSEFAPSTSTPETGYPTPEPDPYNPLSLEEDVEIPLNNRKFFVKEIYEKTIPGLPASLELTNSSQVIADNLNRYTEIPGFPSTQLIGLKHYVYPEMDEQFYLLEPKDDELNPFEEIKTIMEMTASIYLPDVLKEQVVSEILPNYMSALHNRDFNLLTQQVDAFNGICGIIPKDIAHLAAKTTISRYSIHQFLNQLYSRIVSPNVRKLRKYKAFSNFVYGELLPSFMSEVLNQVGLSHGQKFFDLGSGVGNTVFQAALEFGAESYGCEIMEHASYLTDLQLTEFRAKCQVSGFQPGEIKFFLNQSFLDNEEITTIVRDCDVVVANNYVFDADLNRGIVALLQGLKPGSKIITLKPLTPAGYVFDGANPDSILHYLDTKVYEMKEEAVSWTNSKVYYYIATVQDIYVDNLFTNGNLKTRSKKIYEAENRDSQRASRASSELSDIKSEMEE